MEVEINETLRVDFIFTPFLFLSIGRPKDKKNDDSVSLQEALESHYIH